ncbi:MULTISPECIES: proteasome assembly chaperone family protein [Halorussus]|uniref:proteasome assembly chaperone family protein n=1 Tax=Halorussus TaxID=1070314 RepID=UPI00209D8A44|nr:PAC2 family protein [Halorussus vallis]USZ77969.1 PAC2 family protein [Halorussus vallis]USZ78002.1 PAC2 family protein [Halorussus vallis]
MPRTDATARFERRAELSPEAPTLLVGMPENGVVGSIAVNQVTEQLDLERQGHIVSESFPPVTTFGEGRVRDLVRVYAGTDPSVVVPQCDVAMPPEASADLAACIVNDLAADFERAIVLAGVPAQNEEAVGEVTAVVTSEEMASEVEAIGVPLESGVGFIGGTSGAVVNDCYHANVPTIALVVKAHPFLPDPNAARALIEKALEPLVEFDIDTRELEEEAEAIRNEMEQVARYFEQLQSDPDHSTAESSMYQ